MHEDTYAWGKNGKNRTYTSTKAVVHSFNRICRNETIFSRTLSGMQNTPYIVLSELGRVDFQFKHSSYSVHFVKGNYSQ